MKKVAVYIGIIIIILLVVYVNLNYKTREEKWQLATSKLSYVEKSYSDDSFLMSIIYKNNVENGKITLEGKVLRGSVKIGDKIALVGAGKNVVVTVEDILDSNNTYVQEAIKDDRINIIISGISDKEIKMGQVLCAKNTITEHSKFIAEIYILSPDEGGIDKTFKENDTLNFFIRTASFSGKVKSIKENSKVKPSEAATILVEIESKVALEEGTTFVIRDNDQTMGAGQITKVIE